MKTAFCKLSSYMLMFSFYVCENHTGTPFPEVPVNSRNCSWNNILPATTNGDLVTFCIMNDL